MTVHLATIGHSIVPGNEAVMLVPRYFNHDPSAHPNRPNVILGEKGRHHMTMHTAFVKQSEIPFAVESTWNDFHTSPSGSLSLCGCKR